MGQEGDLLLLAAAGLYVIVDRPLPIARPGESTSNHLLDRILARLDCMHTQRIMTTRGCMVHIKVPRNLYMLSTCDVHHRLLGVNIVHKRLVNFVADIPVLSINPCLVLLVVLVALSIQAYHILVIHISVVVAIFP